MLSFCRRAAHSLARSANELSDSPSFLGVQGLRRQLTSIPLLLLLWYRHMNSKPHFQPWADIHEEQTCRLVKRRFNRNTFFFFLTVQLLVSTRFINVSFSTFLVVSLLKSVYLNRGFKMHHNEWQQFITFYTLPIIIKYIYTCIFCLFVLCVRLCVPSSCCAMLSPQTTCAKVRQQWGLGVCTFREQQLLGPFT